MFYIQVPQFRLVGNKKEWTSITWKVPYIYLYIYPLFAQVYSRNRNIEHRTSIHTSPWRRGSIPSTIYVALNPDPGERKEKKKRNVVTPLQSSNKMQCRVSGQTMSRAQITTGHTPHLCSAGCAGFRSEDSSRCVHLVEKDDHRHGKRGVKARLHHQAEHVRPDGGFLLAHRCDALPLLDAGDRGGQHIEAPPRVRALHVVTASGHDGAVIVLPEG
jgi:hypothetical protein